MGKQLNDDAVPMHSLRLKRWVSYGFAQVVRLDYHKTLYIFKHHDISQSINSLGSLAVGLTWGCKKLQYPQWPSFPYLNCSLEWQPRWTGVTAKPHCIDRALMVRASKISKAKTRWILPKLWVRWYAPQENKRTNLSAMTPNHYNPYYWYIIY